MTPIIACHLGAGKQKKDEKYKRLLINALKINTTCTAIDIVENCIKVLEQSGIVNCGYGAVNRECDALIIGKQFGSVCCTTSKHPISMARYLMESKRVVDGLMVPLMVSGDAYFKKIGVYDEREKNTSTDLFMGDTVGCIAYSNNELSVGTSSGGIIRKEPGRIGSSALFGVGGFIKEVGSKSVAITSSGAGEQILLTDFCRTTVNALLITRDTLKTLNECITAFIDHPLLKDYMYKHIGVLIIISDTDNQEILYAHTTPTFFIGTIINGKISCHFSKLSNKLYSIGLLSA